MAIARTDFTLLKLERFCQIASQATKALYGFMKIKTPDMCRAFYITIKFISQFHPDPCSKNGIP